MKRSEKKKRAVIIGGTGHIGSYLTPVVVRAGYETVVITRRESEPYLRDPAWRQVTRILADRKQEDEEGCFAKRVRELDPDVIMDLVCFTPESCSQLIEALRGRVEHYLVAGSIWIHGYAAEQPVSEEQCRNATDPYGAGKIGIEDTLRAARDFPYTVVHPGHITGPGWPSVNPQGNHNPEVFARLARGEEVTIPNWGTDMVHHVHAADVAQVFMRALARPRSSLGESFHAVSPASLTLRGYAEAVASWYDRPARLKFLPFEEWRATVSKKDADGTYAHISRGLCCSIEKPRRLLCYDPAYTSLAAARECMDRLISDNVITLERGQP